LLLASGVCYIFWSNEWKYFQPTPVPQNYEAVNTGQHVDIDSKLSSEKGKPVFIHFFNPDCPCSRFNAPHFNSLVKKYGDRLTFKVVVINKTHDYTADEIKNKFDFNVPVSFDSSVAKICGVYSTPQAVIIDGDRKLYYRGNYNRSRYCTDTKSNYAQMAIASLINHETNPLFSQEALKAYGCQVNVCTK
jgi:thiol-disulfide isomerase/thioredoxin